jgi:hypothetical protein
MTQIIAAITQEYVLLASDRRLIYGDGPRKGEVYDDDSCKLVSLCGTTGIAYSGVGQMKGRIPTHQWIAKTLADAGCYDARCAEQTLVKQAPTGLSATPAELKRHTFLLAGWAHFEDPPALRPYWAMITNTRDSAGKPTPAPLDSFNAGRRYLRPQEDPQFVVAGENITPTRAESLQRNFRRLIVREIGPKEALRLLVDEVINTSKRCPGVGSKVLGFCIPRKAAERFFEKGGAVMLAVQPNPDVAAFTYFEEGYSELVQYGPTAVCGNTAVTDVKTENDPSRDFQSSEIRILSLPKRQPK